MIEQMDATRKSQVDPLASVALLNMTWLTKLIDPFYKTLTLSCKLINDIVDDALAKHEEDFDPENPRDFLDVYLKEIANCKDKSSSFYGKRGRESLKASYFDLIVAGQETTASSITWSLLYLLKFPEVKKKLQDELDREVGRERLVTMDDENNLPFLRAFILESMRMTSLVPQALFHVVAEETTLNGYKIAKGTNVMSNLIHIHHDPRLWKNPEEFNPDRFLSEDKKTVIPNDHLMPFGTGKRICLGQNLAEKEYFLYVANLANTYTLEPVPGDILPSVAVEDNPTTALIRLPPNFRVILNPRK